MKSTWCCYCTCYYGISGCRQRGVQTLNLMLLEQQARWWMWWARGCRKKVQTERDPHKLYSAFILLGENSKHSGPGERRRRRKVNKREEREEKHPSKQKGKNRRREEEECLSLKFASFFVEGQEGSFLLLLLLESHIRNSNRKRGEWERSLSVRTVEKSFPNLCALM